MTEPEVPRAVTLELFVTESELARILPADAGSVGDFLRRVGRHLGADVARACDRQNVGIVLVECPPARAGRFRRLD